MSYFSNTELSPEMDRWGWKRFCKSRVAGCLTFLPQLSLPSFPSQVTSINPNMGEGTWASLQGAWAVCPYPPPIRKLKPPSRPPLTFLSPYTVHHGCRSRPTNNLWVLPRPPPIQQSRSCFSSCSGGSKQKCSRRVVGCDRRGRTPHCVAKCVRSSHKETGGGWTCYWNTAWKKRWR